MVTHPLDFQRGIAMVLKGESLKAGCYVTHAASLGVLREKMVSSFVRNETPGRFRVETGLIRNHARNISSRQCDLLVHESALRPPLYRWEDFVVVDHREARAVLEVKSNLGKKDFEAFLDVHTSILELEAVGQGQAFIPTFGYGLKGVGFSKCLGYVRGAVKTNRLKLDSPHKHLNWPVCVAVQEKNYIGVRPLHLLIGQPAFLLADLTKLQDENAEPLDGIETGIFLDIYSEVLRLERDALVDTELYAWFNQLPLQPEGKVWVTEDGVAHKGNITLA
jgi:hypothetical protein